VGERGEDGEETHLVVEVGEDNVDTLALLAEQVLDRDLDVVKGDVGGSSSGGVGSLDAEVSIKRFENGTIWTHLDGLGLDTLSTGDLRKTVSVG
jgi:hypothetical protein